jgi:hypothetical protein
MADFRIIDADGHVWEKQIVWQEVLEAPYCDEAPKIVMDNRDAELLMVEEKLWPKPVGSLSALPILLT